jgi:hypothetical protein
MAMTNRFCMGLLGAVVMLGAHPAAVQAKTHAPRRSLPNGRGATKYDCAGPSEHLHGL